MNSTSFYLYKNVAKSIVLIFALCYNMLKISSLYLTIKSIQIYEWE